MQAIRLALISLFLITSELSAQHQVWTRTYHGDGEDRAVQIAELPDGKLAVVYFGRTDSDSRLRGRFMLLDSIGSVLRVTPFGEALITVLGGVTRADNGDFLITGSTTTARESDLQHRDVMLARISMEGDVRWLRTYPRPFNDGGGSVARVNDGWIVGGSGESSLHSDDTPFLLRTDDSGKVMWRKEYRLPGTNHIHKVIVDERGITATGFNTQPGGGAGGDWFMLRTSLEGDSLWMRAYRSDSLVDYASMNRVGDYYVVTGSIGPRPLGRSKALMLFVDENGSIVRSREFDFTPNESDTFGPVVGDSSGSWYVVVRAGQYDRERPRQRNGLMRMDSTGELEWMWRDSSACRALSHVARTRDGGLVTIGGTTCTYGTFELRVVRYGYGTPITMPEPDPNEILVTQSCSHIVVLFVDPDRAAGCRITLHATDGTEATNVTNATWRSSINTVGLAAGAYFLRIHSIDIDETRAIIVSGCR